METEVLSSGADHVIGRIERSLMLCCWRDEPTLQAFSVCDSALRRAKELGEKASLLVIIEDGAKPPNAAFRDKSAVTLADLDRHLSASATVVATSGMLGAAIRSILTGISLVSRRNHPTKSFREVQDACAWLSKYVGDANPVALCTAVEKVRRTR
jgi:hypothetical protein